MSQASTLYPVQGRRHLLWTLVGSIMPPRQAGGSTTRASTSGRTTRSKAVPENLTIPLRAQRGFAGNTYGSQEFIPLASGVAHVQPSRGFAAELQNKAKEAEVRQRQTRRSARSISRGPGLVVHDTVRIDKRRQVGALDDVNNHDDADPDSDSGSGSGSDGDGDGDESRDRHHTISQLEDEAHQAARVPRVALQPSPSHSPSPSPSPSPFVARSLEHQRIAQATSKSAEDTFPVEAISTIERQFNESYEGGLESYANLSRLTSLKILTGISWADLFWAAVYTLPIMFLALWLVLYGPVLAATVAAYSCRLPSLLTMPSIMPSVNISRLPWFASKTTEQMTMAATTGSASTRIAVSHGLTDDHRLSNELQRIRADYKSMVKKVNRLEGQLAAQHQPNFFSPKLGATICPFWTSHTRNSVQTWTQWLLSWPFQEFTPLPPITALEPWTENGDCWCAIPSTDGMLFIGIILGREIFPTKLIVDHIPKAAAIDARSAPKRLDLWLRLSEEAGVDAVPAEWRNNAKDCESPVPPGKNEIWICMGRMNYNLDSDDSAQSLDLTGYNQRPPFKVDKAIVRVLENWGNPHTCLYRLKLEGQIPSNAPTLQGQIPSNAPTLQGQ